MKEQLKESMAYLAPDQVSLTKKENLDKKIVVTMGITLRDNLYKVCAATKADRTEYCREIIAKKVMEDLIKIEGGE